MSEATNYLAEARAALCALNKLLDEEETRAAGDRETFAALLKELRSAHAAPPSKGQSEKAVSGGDRPRRQLNSAQGHQRASRLTRSGR